MRDRWQCAFSKGALKVGLGYLRPTKGVGPSRHYVEDVWPSTSISSSSLAPHELAPTSSACSTRGAASSVRPGPKKLFGCGRQRLP